MTVEQLGYAKPDLRNPTLAVMAEILTGAENRYSGIPTIRREMRRAGLPEPVFENRRNEFVVTLFNRREESVPKKADTMEEKILAFCAQPRSRKEIAEFLGVKTVAFAVSRYVAPLLETGELEMTIPEKPKSRRQRFVAKK
jgi:ATP-dependent DNA helicase RecG